MKYSFLHILHLTCTFKSSLPLACYYCFDCGYVKKTTGVIECPPGEHCITVIMSGKTSERKHYTQIDRLCDNVEELWNFTHTTKDDWDLWARSYCDAMGFSFTQLKECKETHCKEKKCNDLTVDKLKGGKQRRSSAIRTFSMADVIMVMIVAVSLNI